MFESTTHLLVTLPFVAVFGVGAFFIFRYFWRRHQKNRGALDVEAVQGTLKSREEKERSVSGNVMSGPNEGERQMETARYYVHEILLRDSKGEEGIVRLETASPFGTVGGPVTVERRLSDGRYQPQGTSSRIAVSSPVMLVLKTAFFLAILFLLLRGLWLPAINAVG
jgi:hypothetical protein